MKQLLFLLLFFFAKAFIATAQISCALERNVNASLRNAVQQYKLLDKEIPDTLLPRSINSDGTLMTCKTNWWTSGFFAGSLWYLYQFSKEDSVTRMAIRRTKEVEKEKWNSSDHDIGFKIMCSFGNALRISKDTLRYAPVIVTAAKTLIKRYKPAVGAIRSWGSISDTTEYRVIIDNMMNLELLFTATRLTKDSSFYKIAVAHADKTLANHFRSDGSSYHLVNYNPKTGAVIWKRTVQGYSNESAWARGQAWGLYGYTLCYRETKLKRYLDQANKIAQFLLKHPNLPKDKIPYWDFNAPNIPYALRDASAAAIIASALFELSKYTSGTTKDWYCNNAQLIINNLTQSSYRTVLGEMHNFLLKHGVGNFPAKSEVDVPLTYADYYYVEAVMRYLQTILQQKVVSFTLINANTDQPIQTLSNGITLNLATLPSRYLNIRANTNPATVGSVVFNLTGTQSKTVTENIVPYALYGDNGSGDYYAWTPAVGSYTLKGTPFAACGGTGTVGVALTVNFTVIDRATTATNLSQENNRMATYSGNEMQGLQVKVYPNPSVGGKVRVEVQNLGQQRATLLLQDMVGRVLAVKHLVADGQGNVFTMFSFNKLLQPGLYLLELQSTVGKAHVKLVVK
jgi:hypothetical protein